MPCESCGDVKFSWWATLTLASHRTGSDDFSVVVLNGVPFKYASTVRRHTRFVQSVDVSMPSLALVESS